MFIGEKFFSVCWRHLTPSPRDRYAELPVPCFSGTGESFVSLHPIPLWVLFVPSQCRQTNPGQVRTNVLNAEELEKVEALRPEANQPRLFTIGYEGQSLEQFLNKLIRQSVAVLCDVRRNPVSMKFGFSKRQLQHACDGTGLGYVHMPELGISSHRRKHLESPSDFQALFRDYVNTTLSENKEALDSIIRLVHDSGRVATDLL